MVGVGAISTDTRRGERDSPQRTSHVEQIGPVSRGIPFDMNQTKLFVVVGFIVSGVLATLTSNQIRETGETGQTNPANAAVPVVINTWANNGFRNAGAKAWKVLIEERGSALDAVEKGCIVCEKLQCDGTVGFGGSPDEAGETTLDAMIMDGVTMNIGAVSNLRNIPDAISVARKVLHNTAHTMLAGNQATQFAVELGFKKQSLATNKSLEIWKNWQKNKCQPNFWRNVSPDPLAHCGPYKALKKVIQGDTQIHTNNISPNNHDTIGMVAIDSEGMIAAGTSTNGARHKIPGRVGDSPIPGAGAYADQDIGGAAATGNGDIMMRFLPSFLAVELMRNGKTPKEAGETAIRRITAKYPDFQGAMVVLRKDGQHAAVCHGLPGDIFPYTFANRSTKQATVFHINCI